MHHSKISTRDTKSVSGKRKLSLRGKQREKKSMYAPHVLVRPKRKRVISVSKFVEWLGKRPTISVESVIQFITARGEMRDSPAARERSEDDVKIESNDKAVSYDYRNMPVLSDDAKALLDRIEKQAVARIAKNPELQGTGELTSKPRSSLNISSKYRASVVTR